MRRAAVGALAVLLACAGEPGARPLSPVRVADTRDDAAIHAAELEYLAFIQTLWPEHATLLGLHGADTRLDDRALSAWDLKVGAEDAILRGFRETLGSPRASRAARTNLTILESTMAVDIRWQRDRRPLETQPDVYTEPLDALFTMTARDYAPASVRAEAVLSRLVKIRGVVAAAKTNLKNPPRVWTQVGIERAAGAAAFFDTLRPFLVSALPDKQLEVDAALTVAKVAYEDYRGFLETDVLPRSTGSFAAGRPLFEFLLRENYMLTEGTDAVRALGQRVFDETDRKMLEVARTIDPSAKGWPEVLVRVKGSHPRAAELRASYAKEVARARAFLVLHDVVPFPPGDICEVVDTPAFQRSTISAAYDEAPPFDKDPHGFFFVTPVDPSLPPGEQEQMLRENDFADEVDTAVHETYPGHHLQISFAREFPSVIRQMTGPAIFEEGWALYSEELMNELGYYKPEERLMQLEWTLVRAARVLLDVGLHTAGMSFEEAVAFLTDKVHLEHTLAVSEVKGYTLEPTHPLAYLLGREKLLELRRRYKDREGAAYTLKRFHTEVLSHGSIVPALLEQEIFEP